MTETNMPDMPAAEDTETALITMADHIADVVDTMTVSCAVVRSEIELRVNPADIPQVLTLLRGDWRLSVYASVGS